MPTPFAAPQIEVLIPHRAPMRLIEALTDCNETEASGTAVFGPDFAVEDGKVVESALVECIAQTTAAALGFRKAAASNVASPLFVTSGLTNDSSPLTPTLSLREREPPPAQQSGLGMLASVSNFKFHRTAAASARLQIDVREIKRFGPMLLVAGRISCEGALIAEGELTVYA